MDVALHLLALCLIQWPNSVKCGIMAELSPADAGPGPLGILKEHGTFWGNTNFHLPLNLTVEFYLSPVHPAILSN